MIREINSSAGIFKLHSAVLGKAIPFQIIFPNGYKNSNEKFPVLYLLHGLFGRFDNWQSYTQITKYAEENSFVIVCAEGGNSWYSDSPRLENHFYESYFFDELIPAVENEFKIDAGKNKCAIAGLSMGGYGAFKFAFRHPEMFCFAASMSGAFHAAEIFNDDRWTELQDSINAVFANDNSHRKADDLFQIMENYPSELIDELPFFYFDCGTEDSFMHINLRLEKALARREIAHQFEKFSGGHDWDYWNSQLRNILQVAAKTFRQRL